MTQGEREYWERRNGIIQRAARTPRCDLALRYFSIEKATNTEGARWQPFQIEVLNSIEMFRSYNKSRQIGMSFTLAGDEMFDGFFKNDHTVIMTSFNLEESREKIVYAKKWWESRVERPDLIPIWEEFQSGHWIGESPRRLKHWPELIKETTLELQWSNGFRMISHPSRPPRGKRASVVLDEFAHYQQDGAIFTAALPMITRGRGRNRITMASTPLGAQGKFWEIHTQPDKYPDFLRADYGWWEIDDLCEPERRVKCLDDFLRGEKAERLVKKYGTNQLRLLYTNNDMDSFLQEYCLSFLDSTHAYLTWELIKSCYPTLSITEDEEADYEDWMMQLDNEYEDAYVCFKARGIDDCIRATQAFNDAVAMGRISGPCYWAFDCGRDRDPAELHVFEVKNGNFNQRLMLTMPNTAFDDMRSVINNVMRCKLITGGLMDQGGNGREIAEAMEKRYGASRITPVWFTAESKDLWATNMKKCMERKKITLIPDRDQEQQLHSIQRKATGSKHMIYEITSSHSSIGGGVKIKHHADKFWTAAMCIWQCESRTSNTIITSEDGAGEPREARAVGNSVNNVGLPFGASRRSVAARDLVNEKLGSTR